jgi:hypothetical protein
VTHIRTQLATGWPEKEPLVVKVMYKVLFFIPRANPDYDKRMHLVHEWWIEFDENGLPGREIGLDVTGKPVLAGPDDRNYGFWLDTNMQLKDFTGNQGTDEVDAETFEARWNDFVSRGGYAAGAV